MEDVSRIRPSVLVSCSAISDRLWLNGSSSAVSSLLCAAENRITGSGKESNQQTIAQSLLTLHSKLPQADKGLIRKIMIPQSHDLGLYFSAG